MGHDRVTINTLRFFGQLEERRTEDEVGDPVQTERGTAGQTCSQGIYPSQPSAQINDDQSQSLLVLRRISGRRLALAPFLPSQSV